MQNPRFRSKIKIPKNISKSILQIIYSFSVKKPLEKRPNIKEVRPFWKLAIMQRLYPRQNPHLGSKIKIKKKRVKIYSTNHLQLFCAKNRSKKDQIFEKWDHFENRPSCKGYIPMQNPHFRSKIKISKNMSKSILQIIYSCSVQKTARKKAEYSRNETILKIGHHAKAIAHAKSSV